MDSRIVSNEMGLVQGAVRVPASKSISNRIMIMRALSDHDFPVEDLSTAGDTVLLRELLDHIIASGVPESPLSLDAGNSGTVFRFLTAFLSIRPGNWLLTGNQRMTQRPAGPLAEALRSMGASIEYRSAPGFPPLLIRGKRNLRSNVEVDASMSSQFVSALMLIGPVLPGGLEISLRGRVVSSPYIGMTARLMRQAGINLEWEGETITIRHGSYLPGLFRVESDWSSVAFWYEAAALAREATLQVRGHFTLVLQGDAVLPGIFSRLGIDTGFNENGMILQKVREPSRDFAYDFTECPDLALPVVVTCAALGVRGRFTGLHHLRLKECDRLESLRQELTAMGVQIRVTADGQGSETMETEPSLMVHPGDDGLNTFGDHRMVMSLAPLCLKLGPLRIRGAREVKKSFPGFWEEMAAAGFTLEPG